MIEFLAIDKKSESNEYDKGILFEKLVKKVVSACGFTDVKLRRKQRSLEYDVSATSNLGNTALIGEAKAIQKKVSEELLKFVAKMLLDWNKNSSTIGLFVSTSELTAEVEDYAREIKLIYNLQIISGEESILNKLAETAGYLKLSQVATLADETYGERSGECIFLVTDRGDYFIQLICEGGATSPTAFCIFDSRGREITDHDFFLTLTKSLVNLKDLKPIVQQKNNLVITSNQDKNISSFLSLVQGKGWFDYKLPASPEYFIGRTSIIDRITNHIRTISEGKTAVRILEILSRSGVGKSSTALKIAELMNSQGNIGVVVDARAIENPLQLINVFSAFIEKTVGGDNTKDYPITIRDIPQAIAKSATVLGNQNKLGIIIIDQFESLFNRAESYNAFVDTMLDILHST